MDTESIPLEIVFPDGNTLDTDSRQKIPVVVSFLASKPISFTTKINFR
jgi:hypothetical protein